MKSSFEWKGELKTILALHKEVRLWDIVVKNFWLHYPWKSLVRGMHVILEGAATYNALQSVYSHGEWEAVNRSSGLLYVICIDRTYYNYVSFKNTLKLTEFNLHGYCF